MRSESRFPSSPLDGRRRKAEHPVSGGNRGGPPALRRPVSRTPPSTPSDRPRRNRERGLAAEAAAARWLVSRGHRILERNLRRRGLGEIDLLTIRAGTLHLVEVKAGIASFEALAGRLDRAKALRLLAVCGLWLAERPEPLEWRRLQLDLLLLRPRPGGWRLRRIEDCCPPEWLLEAGPGEG